MNSLAEQHTMQLITDPEEDNSRRINNLMHKYKTDKLMKLVLKSRLGQERVPLRLGEAWAKASDSAPRQHFPPSVFDTLYIPTWSTF